MVASCGRNSVAQPGRTSAPPNALEVIGCHKIRELSIVCRVHHSVKEAEEDLQVKSNAFACLPPVCRSIGRSQGLHIARAASWWDRLGVRQSFEKHG
jgi:hypothetical protein